VNSLTIAELKSRAAELERQAEALNLDIPGVQQRRAWALRKRYLQQAEDYRNLTQIAMNSGA
jgi:hypothetical protein